MNQNSNKIISFDWTEQNKIDPSIQNTEHPSFTYDFEKDKNSEEYYTMDDVYYNLTSPVSLQYRESMSSASSTSLSRHSTVSSINTTTSYFSAIEPDNSDVLQPTSYFVPCASNDKMNNKRDDITKYHYVVPTFAMVGKKQAQIMQLLFNYDDPDAEKTKEEYERTLSWTISKKNLIVTLSQYTFDKNPVQRPYLTELGQRLGITSILILISLEEMHSIDLLFENVIKSMTNSTDNEWWNRVILVIDQPLDTMKSKRRKDILFHLMPNIQKKYNLSKPLSVFFVDSSKAQEDTYKLQCQEIIWTMLENHSQHGRYYTDSTIQSDDDTHHQLNDIDDDDSTSSDEDDSPFQTVIEYIDGVRKKEPKSKTKHIKLLQRRQIQKLHSYDDDTEAPSN